MSKIEQTLKMKLKLKQKKMKKILPFLKPIFRGALKSIPFGNVVVEIGTSIQETIANKKADSLKPTTHNWLSIAVQIVGLVVIVYSFYIKAITIEQVLEFIGFGK